MLKVNSSGSTNTRAHVEGSTENLGSNGSRAQLQLSTDLHLNAGDQVWIEVKQYNDAGDDAETEVISGAVARDYFSGHLVYAD